MNASAAGYVVVCPCTGEIKPIAYVNDNRPTGGSVVVTAVEPEGAQIISATGYNPWIENWRAPAGYVEGKWAERNVSETVWDWDEVHTGWTIRCGQCRQQAQMSRERLAGIIDRAQSDQLALVSTPEPGEPQVQSWTEDGWAQGEIRNIEWHQRYLIMLGVLVREAQ